MFKQKIIYQLSYSVDNMPLQKIRTDNMSSFSIIVDKFVYSICNPFMSWIENKYIASYLIKIQKEVIPIIVYTNIINISQLLRILVN